MIHIVETFFDIDRPTHRTSEDWVMFRYWFFLKYTYPALQNQRVRDFAVLVHCGGRNAELTKKLHWPAGVEIAYDFGRAFYSRIQDAAAITRIDSDDLLRDDALEAVRAAIAAAPKQRFFAFKKNLCWDMINDLIFDHVRGSTPFVTRIYPPRIFRDYPAFAEAHFRAHGSGGLGDRRAAELPRRRVLVTKHGQNTNLIKRGKAHPVFTAEEKKNLKAYNDDGKRWPIGWRTADPVEIQAIVRRFGVNLVL